MQQLPYFYHDIQQYYYYYRRDEIISPNSLSLSLLPKHLKSIYIEDCITKIHSLQKGGKRLTHTKRERGTEYIS
jgi:hypothetical protein